jgi:hypothetical protein
MDTKRVFIEPTPGISPSGSIANHGAKTNSLDLANG